MSNRCTKTPFSCVGTQEATLPVPTQENRSFVLAYLGGNPPNPHYLHEVKVMVGMGGFPPNRLQGGAINITINIHMMLISEERAN